MHTLHVNSIAPIRIAQALLPILARSQRKTIASIMPLLGVIPDSQEVLRASNLGAPVTLINKGGAPARADLAAAKKLRAKRW